MALRDMVPVEAQEGTVFDKLKSRKFWFALIGALLPVIIEAMTGAVGWEAALTLAVGVIVSYIFGQGYVDGQEASGTALGATAEAISTLDE